MNAQAKRNNRSWGNKQHAQPKRGYNPGAAPVSRTLVITVLLLVGASVWALYALNQVEVGNQGRVSTPGTPSDIDKSARAVSNERVPADQQAKSDGDYDFYSKLKDFEVEILEADSYSSDRAEDASYHYIIQAGSFKTEEQADRRRAELTLLGLEPKIDHNTNSRGEMWYRVRLGPFESKKKMAEARTSIIGNGVEAMVMKRKKSG